MQIGVDVDSRTDPLDDPRKGTRGDIAAILRRQRVTHLDVAEPQPPDIVGARWDIGMRLDRRHLGMIGLSPPAVRVIGPDLSVERPSEELVYRHPERLALNIEQSRVNPEIAWCIAPPSCRWVVL